MPAARPYARTFDARRARILAEAWNLIAEYDGGGFSLTELAARADVAPRTIYNAFSDKDRVVAEAVAAHYVELFADMNPEQGEGRSLAEALEMVRRVVEEIARVVGWSKTAAGMYFSPRTNPRIVDSLREMPLMILEAWLHSGEADPGLLALLAPGEFRRSFANAQWALTSDWAGGRIDVEGLARGMEANLIVLALALGNTACRAEAQRLASARQISLRATAPKSEALAAN